jgi:glycosidase
MKHAWLFLAAALAASLIAATPCRAAIDTASIYHGSEIRYVNLLAGRVLQVRLRVKAGDASRCEVYLPSQGKSVPMRWVLTDGCHDYWIADVHLMDPYLDYAFRIADGPHHVWYCAAGAGRYRPRNGFFRYERSKTEPFVTPSWVKDAVFYQIFVERFHNGDRTNDPPCVEAWGGKPRIRNFFGGDLRGVIDRVPYLKDLGVTALYLNPIFEASTNHKYNTTDYFRIDPHFGDLAVMKELVETCHREGIRVVLDGVFNHTGVDFFAFRDLCEKGEASRYKSWFTVKSFPVRTKPEPTYYCWWNIWELPKLNVPDPEVEKYILDVATYWIREARIDGWRLDVPEEIYSGFWVKFRDSVKKADKDSYIVGEIWSDATPWLKGDTFDGVMNYRLREAILDFIALRKIGAAAFDRKVQGIFIDYPWQGAEAMLNLVGSHDTARVASLCTDARRLPLVYLLQMTLPGAPCIYYGDEVGMEGGKDPDCRRTFDWGDPSGSALRRYIKRLIEIRRTHGALRDGRFIPWRADDRNGIYGFIRDKGGDRVAVAVNSNKEDCRVAVDLAGRRTVIDCVTGERLEAKGRSLLVPVPAFSGRIFLLK